MITGYHRIICPCFNHTMNTFLKVYMVKDQRKPNYCHFMDYYFQLPGMGRFNAPFHKHDSTYHSVCYTSCRALAEDRNTSMGPPRGIDLRTCSIIVVLMRLELGWKHACVVTRFNEREMFYLTTHSTHFINGYMASYIMVKDHSDSEKGNPLPPHID